MCATQPPEAKLTGSVAAPCKDFSTGSNGQDVRAASIDVRPAVSKITTAANFGNTLYGLLDAQLALIVLPKAVQSPARACHNRERLANTNTSGLHSLLRRDDAADKSKIYKRGSGRNTCELTVLPCAPAEEPAVSGYGAGM